MEQRSKTEPATFDVHEQCWKLRGEETGSIIGGVTNLHGYLGDDQKVLADEHLFLIGGAHTHNGYEYQNDAPDQRRCPPGNQDHTAAHSGTYVVRSTRQVMSSCWR